MLDTRLVGRGNSGKYGSGTSAASFSQAGYEPGYGCAHAPFAAIRRCGGGLNTPANASLRNAAMLKPCAATSKPCAVISDPNAAGSRPLAAISKPRAFDLSRAETPLGRLSRPLRDGLERSLLHLSAVLFLVGAVGWCRLVFNEFRAPILVPPAAATYSAARMRKTNLE